MTDLAHQKVGFVIKEGDYVIDATAGNGNDTIFLAEKVGPTGRVYAFDIQEEALVRTAERLQEKDIFDRVTLIHSGHERLSEHVKIPVAAAMYNLGYLPGGKQQVATKSNTTARSIMQALKLLKPGGIATIVLYPGHVEGRREKEELLPIFENMASSEYAVLYIKLLNQTGDPPELLVVQKIHLLSEPMK